jgi:hypothetical protein
MSTSLDDENGGCIATRYYGGKDRGLMIDVNMTSEQADARADMFAIEETSEEPTTLGVWLDAQKARGCTVRYASAERTRYR